jgi:ATP-dependent DNA ligase
MQLELASQPFHREAWVYEEKLDGWRMIAYKHGPRVRLVSRSPAWTTRPLPWDRQLILDGEVCVFDDQLVSQFHLLGWGGADEATIRPRPLHSL